MARQCSRIVESDPKRGYAERLGSDFRPGYSPSVTRISFGARGSIWQLAEESGAAILRRLVSNQSCLCSTTIADETYDLKFEACHGRLMPKAHCSVAVNRRAVRVAKD